MNNRWIVEELFRERALIQMRADLATFVCVLPACVPMHKFIRLIYIFSSRPALVRRASSAGSSAFYFIRGRLLCYLLGSKSEDFKGYCRFIGVENQAAILFVVVIFKTKAAYGNFMATYFYCPAIWRMEISNLAAVNSQKSKKRWK